MILPSIEHWIGASPYLFAQWWGEHGKPVTPILRTAGLAAAGFLIVVVGLNLLLKTVETGDKEAPDSRNRLEKENKNNAPD